MSRHRNVKRNNLEYSDCDSQSGSFTDDDYGASPNTMALYMYDESKGNSRNLSSFIKVENNLNISEDCFPDHDEDVFQMDNMKITVNIGNEQINVDTPKKLNKQDKIEKNNGNSSQEDVTPKIIGHQKIDKKIMAKTEETKEKLSDFNKTSTISQSTPVLKKSKQASKPLYNPEPGLEAYEKFRSDHNRRPLINLIVVGHVDAGKSTLMGNLLYNLNYVSQKQINKYKHEAQKAGKSSFAYAWVLDESIDERSRGITTDVAQTYFETQNRRIQLLDAPGHKDFIPNMIGGASQADAAILVVDSVIGKFETGFDNIGGQTREHMRLIKILGVNNVIVAVNKLDCVNWDKNRFDFIKNKLDKFLKALKFDVKYCPVSGLNGSNLKDNPSDEEACWIKSNGYPTLIDLIDSLEAPNRYVNKPLRFAVTDIFKPIASSNYVVSGRLESGVLSTETRHNLHKVLVLPSNNQATIRTIKMNNGQSDDNGASSESSLTYAFDGDHVILFLSGIEVVSCVEPGSILCHPEFPMPCSNRIRAQLLIFGIKDSRCITKNYCVTFYYQQISIPAQFSKLLSYHVANNSAICNEHNHPRAIPLNSQCTATVDLVLDRSICIDSQDQCKRLSKFTLRDNGVTIAGGTVVKVLSQSQGFNNIYN